MKFSIGITTHNEGEYFTSLMNTLLGQLRGVTYDYEIVVVDDFSTDETLINAFKTFKNDIRVVQHSLNGDFSTHKNFLSDQCKGEYIFQIDADEKPAQKLIQGLDGIVVANSVVDVFDIPRVNTVDGITLRHIKMWGWKINSFSGFSKTEKINSESGFYDLLQSYDLIKKQNYSPDRNVEVEYMIPIINWPDLQKRLWKNNPTIRWEGKVHETLVGYNTIGKFPLAMEFSIWHHKDIRRQEQQNIMYSQIIR